MVRVRAPELPQDLDWLNCDMPLSLKNLRGRLVLLDFWTYCCINCLHILPQLKYFEQKYKDCLTVIGIHSSKFDNEREVENIRQAILRYDIEHPVLVDRNFDVWQHYAVRAYPTLVLIDPKGYVVHSVVGEGDSHALDRVIAELIETHQEQGTINREALQLTLEKQRQPVISPLAFPGKVLADEESDRLFIADSGHHRIVMTNLEGEIVSVIGNGTAGLTDGDFTTARFSAPQGMEFDRSQQILYVADTENHAIRQIDLQMQSVQTIAGTGQQNRSLRPQLGQSLEIALNSPWDLVQVEHCLYIAMAGSHQIWQLNLSNGSIRTYAGTGAEFCVDGAIDQAAFAQPSGITTNGVELFVADSETSTIRAVSLDEPPYVRTICGSGDLYGFGDRDGQGDAVRLQHCLGIEAAHGQLWLADTYNHKIKRVDVATGNCHSILGNGTAGLRDGQRDTSQFAEPSGLSLAAKYLYIADTNNHAIRRVALDTMTVTTLTFPGLCAPNLCFPNLSLNDA